MPAHLLDIHEQQFDLLRPGTQKDNLQAWDAADTYLIETLKQHPTQNYLMLNDNFGALGTALQPQISAWISDSKCALDSLTTNLCRNQLPNIETYTALDEWPSNTQYAAMRLPKNLSYLKFQLHKLFNQGITKVYLAGMMKHLPKNILDLLLKYGPVNRYPFKKKATIFELDLERSESSQYPRKNVFSGINLTSHANVFGRDKLDQGAQFVLENIKSLPSVDTAADLCCGSGILGLAYLNKNPQCAMDFFDESHMAVESARLSTDTQTYKNAHFHWCDGLSDCQSTFDLILCNPPFHEQHTVGDHIARRLFKDSKQHLHTGGKLIVVGNRHLNYHITLKQTFNHVQQIAANKKFVLLCAHD